MRSVIVLLATMAAPTFSAAAQEPDLGSDAQRQAGEALYQAKCSQCHGKAGDGQGVAAAYFMPVPRDFTSGIFKFRTTASGELPSTADIHRSIKNGMPYTGMPAWPSLSDQQITNLAYYLKTFSSDFAGPYGVVEIIDIPKAVKSSAESIARGREVYEENQCFDCHGNAGRGDGKSSPTLEDQWGNHIRPADLSKRWTFRNGGTKRDIWRTFTTGLDGSPMPSYEIDPPEDAWHLVNYVHALSRDEADYGTAATASYVEGDIDVMAGRAVFGDEPGALFSVVGQVIEPGREFYPGVNAIEIKAVYNADEIAFMLAWHDMTAEETGSNAPNIPVPAWQGAKPLSDGQYSDAVAVLLPSKTPEGQAKPYFMFGDRRNSMDIWFVDLATKEPSFYVGRGTERIEAGETELTSWGRYEDGEWLVVVKGPRRTEGGLAFEEGSFVPITFSVWDGFNEERGNKRGLTSWYNVYVAPSETASPVLPVLAYGLGTLLLGIGIVFFTRRRANGKS